MDRRERIFDEAETYRLVFETMQASLWTAMPCIVKSFNAEKMTVAAQPTINGQYRGTDGQIHSLQMPVLLDCPVLWMGGGGVTATFPIAAGDECLVIFGSRCIDAWWSSGRVQDPTEIRMHDLSDGFALVGLRSLPRAYAPDAARACLTSDDRSTFFALNPATQAIQITAPGGITINGVQIDSSGNVTTSATVTAITDVVGGGKSLKTHTHSGVQTGSGTSGPPT